MTEEELVEKVARAIWASEYISTFPDIPILEADRETVMGQARAAIAAMREAGFERMEKLVENLSYGYE